MSSGGGKRELTPEAHAAIRAGGARGNATRRREREAGLAFAREWRERHRGVDWSLPNG